MKQDGIDHRTGKRFRIPDAILSYSAVGTFRPFPKRTEESCKLKDISRGGLLFYSKYPLKISSSIKVVIALPENNENLIIKGKVTWIYPNDKESSKYEIGIKFKSYGKKIGHNPPECLIKIVSLEKKYLKEPNIPTP